MTARRLIFFFFLLFVSGLPARLGIISRPAVEIITLFFSVTGLFAFAIYLAKKRYKIDYIDFYILIFTVAFPILSALTARITTGQPVYMGLLTFRGMYILYALYVFKILKLSGDEILKDTSFTVVIIILTVSILFFFFGYNDFNTAFVKGSYATEYGYTLTKGMQFSGYTCLFFIPYLAGWVRFFEEGKPRYLIIPLLVLLTSVYISKARNEIFSLSVIPLLLYYIKYRLPDMRFLLITISLIALFSVVILTDNVVSRSFSGLFKPSDLNFAQETGDYSAYIRLQETKDALKWFSKYPITGLGSLSYRYNNGYMGIISDFFFVADIGIFGILVKGGLLLLILYLFFYVRLLNIFSDQSFFANTGRYMIIFMLIELAIGNDLLANVPGTFVILFLLGSPEIANLKRIAYNG